MTKPTDDDRPAPIHTPEHRERIAARKKEGATGAHIDPAPKDYSEQIRILMDTLYDRERQLAEQEKLMNTPAPVKKVMEWTFNPQFFLTAGMAVAGVVASLTISQFNMRQEIHDQGARIDRVIDTVQNMQLQNRTDKEAVDKRAANYIPVIEALKQSQAIQDTRIQNMIDGNADFRRVTSEAIAEMAKTVTRTSEAVSAITTEVAVMRAREANGPSPQR